MRRVHLDIEEALLIEEIVRPVLNYLESFDDKIDRRVAFLEGATMCGDDLRPRNWTVLSWNNRRIGYSRDGGSR